MALISWTAEAEDDLLAIVEFIGLWSATAAERMAKTIKESTRPLSEHPMMFRESARVAGCREIVVHPNYIVVYKILEDRILVVNVFHAKRDYPKIDI